MARSQIDRYLDRAVAFIDILGFSQAIRSLTTAASFDRIVGALNDLRDNKSVNAMIDPEIKINIFSDSVFLSAPLTGNGFQGIVRAIQNLTLDLLEQGYFLRGGLTVGKLYHDDEIVVGQGLLDAIYLEREIARFPRVVASRRFQETAIDLYRNGELYLNWNKVYFVDLTTVLLSSMRWLWYLIL